MKLKKFLGAFLCTMILSCIVLDLDQVEARGAARYETTGTLESSIKLTTDLKMYNNFSGGYDSRLRAVTVNGVSVPAFCVDFGKVGSASLTQQPYTKLKDNPIDESTPVGRALVYAVLRGYSNDGNTAWYGANTVPALFKDYAAYNNVDNRYYATQLAIWQILKHYGTSDLKFASPLTGADLPNNNSPIVTVAKNLYEAAISYADNYDGRDYQLYPSIHGATAKSTLTNAKAAKNQGYYEIPLTLQSTGYNWMKVTVSGGTNVKFYEGSTQLATGNSWTWENLDPLKNGSPAYSKNIKIRVDVPDKNTNVTVTIESDNAVYNPKMYAYEYSANTSAQRILVPLFEIKTKKFYKQYTYTLTTVTEDEPDIPYIPEKPKEPDEPEEDEPEPKITTTGNLIIYKTTQNQSELLAGAELSVFYVGTKSQPTEYEKPFFIIPKNDGTDGRYIYCGLQESSTKDWPDECDDADVAYAASWVTVTSGGAGLEEGVGFTPIKANPIIIENVPTGNYQVREERSPKGYYSGISGAGAALPVTVYEGDNSAYVKNYKKPTGSVEISKQDATTSEELPGASLKLVKDDGNCDGDLVAAWESSTEPYIITDLEDGTYCLTEIIAPDGYDTSEETVKITITNGSAEKAVMKNSPTPGNPDTSDLDFVLIGGLVLVALVAGGYATIKLRKEKEMIK